jgi:hypothetical protein
LNKSGNALSAEFEKAFAAFCYKCGHFSHKGQDCKIYPDSTAVLTLCSKCRHGLHDECKSRRKFYPKQNVNQLHYFQRDGCIIFKEMVFGTSIHRTLCGGDLTT